MENTNEVNIGDILPPKKDTVEKFSTSDTVIPEFIKRAAYSPDETMEETITRDWQRLVEGLSDYVLAEQLTERELIGMGKPVAENYAEYFHDTLKDVKKSRKKAEQKLFKLIPRHSQLESCEFFSSVQEQNEKEKEARERAMELYPPAGVAKLDHKDDARKGLKKEATKEHWCTTCGHSLAPDEVTAHYDKRHTVEIIDKKAAWVAPEAVPGSQTNPEAGVCEHCRKEVPAQTGLTLRDKLFCMQCHDEGHSVLPDAAAPLPPAPENLPPISTSTPPSVIPPMPEMKKEASCEESGSPIETEADAAVDPKDALKQALDMLPDLGGEEGVQELAKAQSTHTASLADSDKNRKFARFVSLLAIGLGGMGASLLMNLAEKASDVIHEAQAKLEQSNQQALDVEKEFPKKKSELAVEAAAKWKPGQNLRAKLNGTDACVVYVNEDDKTYIVKVWGTMYPSYYSYDDAHSTFDAIKLEDSKDGPEAKMRGLS